MGDSAFTMVYALLTVGLIFFEGVAIGIGRRRATISGHIWAARAQWIVFPMAILWFWMTFHFWNPVEPDGAVWNDVAYLVLGFLVGILNFRYARRYGTRT